MHKRETNAPRPVYASSMQCARNESGGRKDRLGQRERESGTSGHMGKCDSFIIEQPANSIDRTQQRRKRGGGTERSSTVQNRRDGVLASTARPTSTFVP